MIKVKFTVYVSVNTNKVSKEIETKAINKLIATLETAFGGLTIVNSQGAWSDKSGYIHYDTTKVFSSLTDINTFSEQKSSLLRVINDIRVELKELSILWELSPIIDFGFIE